MNTVFDEILENISDSNFYGIWNDLFRDRKDLTTSEKKNIFLNFFEYGMKKNIILEYDLRERRLVFSREEAAVVVSRIFSDLKDLNLSEENGDNESDFIAYAMTKYGWAVLRDGTYLFLPD